MNHKISLDYLIFWSSIFTALVISHKANGILTDSNELHCTHIQCPTKCPQDSYLQSALDDEEDDFEDYEDELLGHDPYLEEIGGFEEIPPEEDLHDNHSPQHVLKERQKREVFFQNDIEKCCDNQKCVCNKCPDVPKCFEGQVAVEIFEGQGVPGNCCSIFRCAKKEQCQLGVKQSWWTNKCTKCSCFGENELCMQICPYEEILQNCYSTYLQKPMMNGAFWKEGSCTSCSCEQGERRCFTSVCPKLECTKTVKFENQCCAKCLDDDLDLRSEIVHNNKTDFIDVGEDDNSAEATTIVTPIINTTTKYNKTYSPADSSFPTVDENQTTSPFVFTKDSSTAAAIPKITQEISSTVQTEISENSSTAETNRENPSSEAINISTTTTEGSTSIMENDLNSSTISVSSEQSESVTFSTLSSTTEVQITSTAARETLVDFTTEATLTTDNSIMNTLQENIASTAISYMENTPTTATTSTLIEYSSPITQGSSPNIDTISTTNQPTDTSTAAANSFSTSAATDTGIGFESTTAHMISSSGIPLIFFNYTTNNPLDLNETAELNSSTSSAENPSSPLTSTTSSPYETSSDLTTTTNQEILTTSTTPEPQKPIFHSYGDFITNVSNSSTQTRMRIIFDEIDYVVMIVLFIGSLLCISLGLIIRHTKNRKKMYSSVPSSETSLSQTSTNTVSTV